MNRFDMFTQLRNDIKDKKVQDLDDLSCKLYSHILYDGSLKRLQQRKYPIKDIFNEKARDLDYTSFKLTAVIVHDIADKNLVDRISQNFVNWAEMTGSHFLFITFVPPSEEWKNSEYCHDSYSIDPNTLSVDKNWTKEYEQVTLPWLRDFLGLPQTGSYIILTNDLSSNNTHQIQTDADTIENQFQLITKYCEDEAAGKEHTPGDFTKLLRTLKADRIELLSNLLDRLIDITSMVTQINPINFYSRQIDHAQDVINKERKNLIDYVDEVDFEDKLLRLYNCISIFCKNQELAKRRLLHGYREPRYTYDDEYDDRRRHHLFNHVNEDLLDDYSFKLLTSYHWLEKYLQPTDNATLNYLDYSGFTLYLAKIIENEMHLSIGQSIRCTMGIDMPENYNKVCEGGDISVTYDGQVTHLNWGINKEHNAPVKGIPMGVMLTIYDAILNNPQEIKPNPQSERLIRIDHSCIRFLKNFSKYRNNTTHLDENSQRTYENAKDMFFQDFLEHYLFILDEVKGKLRGDFSDQYDSAQYPN